MSDELWELLEPLIPKEKRVRQRARDVSYLRRRDGAAVTQAPQQIA